MAAVQLSFTLRTSNNVKTVHLLGSWDGYHGQLPLSKDSTKRGGWKGTFRFQGLMIQQGQRYWYYYILDGYHVSHDPAHAFTTEPTTGRELNILDVPAGPTRASHRRAPPSIEIPTGRPLSFSQIKSPRPEKPYSARHLYEHPTADELAHRFSQMHMLDLDHDLDLDDDNGSSDGSRIDEDVSYRSSPPSSVGSLTSRSASSYSRSRGGRSTSPSSVSDDSPGPGTPVCTCQRYGITRKGDRIKIDCGGSRCGGAYSSASDCSSESDEDRRLSAAASARLTRRRAVVVRR
ncbi:MAG: hypothetical protein M1826_007096 [Phylliscum demangeonii]|nr:MAG: hypothetical protein M1826_007096 [Phylliscum demangeonii]